MKYLVTGNGGSGKSAICSELRARGFKAIDADDNGLSRWEDAKTGKPIKVDPAKFVDYSRVAWNWDKSKITEILDANQNVFICGSASNQFDFYPFFDKVFVLNPKPTVQRQRLLSRQSNYGKDKATIDWIIDDQKKVVQASEELGALVIDANLPLDSVVKNILEATYEN